MKKYFSVFIVIFIMTNCQASSSSDSTATVNAELPTRVVTLINQAGERFEVTAEIADDESERSTGLMNRQSLADNQGMLFVFEEEEPRIFWMKDTYVSLDILFLDDAKIIVAVSENTTPLSETLIPSGEGARYALEVPAGFFDQKNLELGDQVAFDL